MFAGEGSGWSRWRCGKARGKSCDEAHGKRCNKRSSKR
jgi:hypothetical protein